MWLDRDTGDLFIWMPTGKEFAQNTLIEVTTPLRDTSVEACAGLSESGPTAACCWAGGMCTFMLLSQYQRSGRSVLRRP